MKIKTMLYSLQRDIPAFELPFNANRLLYQLTIDGFINNNTVKLIKALYAKTYNKLPK